VVASLPGPIKEKLEGAVRRNAEGEASKQRKTQKKMPAASPKQPTIQLKLDFSNFGSG
jgi:hypothetical protein